MAHWTSPFKASHFHFTGYLLNELCLQAQVPYQEGYMATTSSLVNLDP